MADDLTTSGGRDRRLISLSQDFEVRDWSKKFAVDPDVLRAAVRTVGNEAEKVEAYLKSRKK